MFCERYRDQKYPVNNPFHLEKPYAFRVIPITSPLPFTALVNQFPSVIPHKKPIYVTPCFCMTQAEGQK